MPRLLLIVSLVFSLLASAAAQTSDVEEIPDAVAQRSEVLADMAEDLSEGRHGDLIELQDEVRELRRLGEADQAVLTTKLNQIQADMERLGPAPEEGESESEAIATERKRLNQEFQRYDAARRQAALNIAETQRLLLSVAERRRDRFREYLLTRDRSPFEPDFWADAWSEFQDRSVAGRQAFTEYWSERSADSNLRSILPNLLIAVVLALILFGPVRLRLYTLIKNRTADLDPLPSRKVLVAASRIGARILPGLLGGYILLEALRFSEIITPEGVPLARAIWVTFVGFLLVEAAAMAIFSPALPAWRIVPLSTWQARQVSSLSLTAVFVLGTEYVVNEANQFLAPTADAAVLLALLVTLFLALILILLTRRSLWRVPSPDMSSTADGDEVEAGATGNVPGKRYRVTGRLLALAAILAALSGYITLGHFLMTRVFFLMLLSGAVWTLRALLREGVRMFDNRLSAQPSAPATEESGQLSYFWISFTIDVLAFLVFVPPALLILGADWSDVSGLVVDAFVGFSIGNVRISLMKILMAVLIIALIIYVTRIIQRTAETRIFRATRMDSGVQNSLKTLIGYVGLIIAFMAGIGFLGFNLSNLAIIAGALSVGIGFGLQSIVNNFVSGLILLFERPIKVGDWIVTSSGEGTVQRISVRSTEIRTFDRSSIIVPNAELISNAVTNWTHKDTIGRVVIPVGITYSYDPEVALKLLEEVAQESKDFLKYPAPYAYFAGFGDSSLDLELRGYIRDINQILGVRTNLRVAIWKKFREKGVEIPFPQRDLHIRSSFWTPSEAPPEPAEVSPDPLAVTETRDRDGDAT